MIILYIAGINDNKSAGPNTNIPKNIFYGSKYETIGIYNIYETKTNDILKYKNYFSKETMKNNDITTLPFPFNNPDLVVFEEVYRVKYAKIAKSLKKKGIPYVITPRGSLTYHSQKRKAFKKLIGNILFFNHFVKNAASIHYLTDKEYETSKSFKINDYFVVGNGVEIKKKIKTFENIKDKKKYNVTFIGRIAMYHKGLDYLVEAINNNKSEFRKYKFEFNLYGPDDLDSKKILNSKIEQYKISDLIKINDPVFVSEKEKILLDTDLFVHTSRLEGQPTAVIEAMSYGVPVLVTPGTNIDELVRKEKLGFVAEFDIISISKKLLDSYKKRNEFSKISANEIAIIANSFDWNAIMKKTIDEYKKIIKNGGSKC